jgi:hypothetical protein
MTGAKGMMIGKIDTGEKYLIWVKYLFIFKMENWTPFTPNEGLDEIRNQIKKQQKKEEEERDIWIIDYDDITIPPSTSTSSPASYCFITTRDETCWNPLSPISTPFILYQKARLPVFQSICCSFNPLDRSYKLCKL